MIALSSDVQAAVLDNMVSLKVLLHQNSMMLVELTLSAKISYRLLQRWGSDPFFSCQEPNSRVSS